MPKLALGRTDPVAASKIVNADGSAVVAKIENKKSKYQIISGRDDIISTNNILVLTALKESGNEESFSFETDNLLLH
ncbi:MAG: hypothetical protein ACOX75_08410 [Lachnospiraceae bacterium]|jgi:hypothetical protein